MHSCSIWSGDISLKYTSGVNMPTSLEAPNATAAPRKLISKYKISIIHKNEWTQNWITHITTENLKYPIAMK